MPLFENILIAFLITVCIFLVYMIFRIHKVHEIRMYILNKESNYISKLNRRETSFQIYDSMPSFHEMVNK